MLSKRTFPPVGRISGLHMLDNLVETTWLSKHFIGSPHTYLCLGVSVCSHPACDDCSWAVEAQSCQRSVKVESWLSSWRGHKQHRALPISFPWGQGKNVSRTSYCHRNWEETTQRKHATTFTLSHNRTALFSSAIFFKTFCIILIFFVRYYKK